VDGHASEPCRAVCGHHGGGRLLQRLLGEQPARRVGKLDAGPAPKQRRLDEYGRTIAETLTRRGDVGDAVGVGQREGIDLGQRKSALVAGQVGDVGKGETQATLQDGLTPVTMTL
jgi:hypothetical protein